MLNLNEKKRPTCKDPLGLKFINLRVREKRERDKYNELKRLEEKIKKESKEITAKEKQLAAKKEALVKKQD